MTATIPIQDLPSATSPLNGAAYMIIKDGATDKKATITQIRAVDLSALSNLPSSAPNPVASDLMMIGRGANTYKTLFQTVGLVKNTKAWFWQAAAPSGWAVDPTATADSLLAVKSTSGTYATAGSSAGTWQQANHTLTINEMPSHSHRVTAGKDSSGSSTPPKYSRRASNFDPDSVMTAEPVGGGQPHNHGSTWRPLANVGLLCYKTG